MIRGIRGATTVTKNTSQEIIDKTESLLREIVVGNNIEPDDISSIIFSVTEDIDADFPAKAIRRLSGFTYVPVMCVKEVPVPNSLPFCIRVMMSVNTKLAPNEVKHVYREGAVDLRPDLRLTNNPEI